MIARFMDRVDQLPTFAWALVVYALAMAPIGLVAAALFVVLPEVTR